MPFRKLTEKDVTFTLTCEPEHIPYVGNCSAVDPVTDRKQEGWVRRQLAAGNEWAWCQVKVTAHYEEHEASDYLGACSYLSAKDFKSPGGYYDDMKATALAALNDILREEAEAEELEHTEP